MTQKEIIALSGVNWEKSKTRQKWIADTKAIRKFIGMAWRLVEEIHGATGIPKLRIRIILRSAYSTYDGTSQQKLFTSVRDRHHGYTKLWRNNEKP